MIAILEGTSAPCVFLDVVVYVVSVHTVVFLVEDVDEGIAETVAVYLSCMNQVPQVTVMVSNLQAGPCDTTKQMFSGVFAYKYALSPTLFCLSASSPPSSCCFC